MTSKIIKGILVLLGFGSASCDDTNGFGQVDMYGVPFTQYSVRGRVVDGALNPVKGIKISAIDEEYAEISGGNGEFCWQHGGFLYGQAELVFTDIDGDQNGGEFAEKRIVVEFTDDDLTASRAYEKIVGDVELELKKDE